MSYYVPEIQNTCTLAVCGLQREGRAKDLEEAIVGAAYFLDYHSNYELSRCCREYFCFIRRYYAAYRKLKVDEGKELKRFQRKLAAINHVVGDRALISLEELEISSNRIMVVSLFWATVIMSSATTLRTLRISGMVFDAFPKVLKENNFTNLQTLEIAGDGASRWLAMIAVNCASTLDDLMISEHRIFVEGPSINLKALRNVYVYGNGASRWFASIAMGCRGTLLSLGIVETRPRRGSGSFVEGMPSDFTRVKRLVLQGNGASKWFATFATGDVTTLEYLHILEYSNFVKGIPSDFRMLRNVDVEGKGASTWFANISKGCTSSLGKIRIDDRQIIIWDELTTVSPFELFRLQALLELARDTES
eukprot:GHVU01094356.1.p1 GENE.GHVU01094356.1~~GHVU01094356.1.p1  ORF type:complete len:363 (+),score=32.68 GHVU01094356.1:853-1941(+)